MSPAQNSPERQRSGSMAESAISEQVPVAGTDRVSKPCTAVENTDQQQIDQYWSTYAEAYAAHQRSRLRMAGERQAWQQVWAEALPSAPASVLDVGTGSGHAALLIAELGHDVTAIDRAEGMLAQARCSAGELAQPPVFLTGDATDPPFEPASFEAVTARYVLWTMPDPVRVLRTWRELLRPGGTLVVVDGLWFTDGLLNSVHAGNGEARTRDFRDAYAKAVEWMTLAEATGIEDFAAAITEAGFTEVVAQELPQIIDLDLRHGVAKNHSVQMNYRITARR